MQLKPIIVHMYTLRIENKKIDSHDAISAVSINRNGCTVLIFKKMWAYDASASQTEPNITNYL